jgi:hypothetical protein
MAIIFPTFTPAFPALVHWVCTELLKIPEERSEEAHKELRKERSKR